MLLIFNNFCVHIKIWYFDVLQNVKIDFEEIENHNILIRTYVY